MLTATSVRAQWQQVGANVNGEAAGDVSGRSVALSADSSRLAIGAPGNDGNGHSAGLTRVYDLIAGTWTQVGADIDGENENDSSGYSVSLSADGSRLAIGSPFHPGIGIDPGHTRVYDLVAGSWSQVGADIDGEAAADWSGQSVALSADGSRLAIGARGNDGNGSAAGHTRVYDWNGAAWVQVGADIDGEAALDKSGWSVALSADGSRLAIGAPQSDGTGSRAGYTRVYDLVAGTWTQVGTDIDGDAPGDLSGFSVALSADGLRLVIGAPFADGTDRSRGHVRVYDLVAGTWTQVGAGIDGEAPRILFGYSVALSADGLRLAIGAPNQGDSPAGHTRVFDGPAELGRTRHTGLACPGRFGHVPQLFATGIPPEPYQPNPTFGLRLADGLPSSVAILMVAAQRLRPTPSSACQLLLGTPFIVRVVPVLADGTANTPLPIPPSLPDLIGATFYVQAGVIDPNGGFDVGAVSLSLTDLLWLIIGG